MEKVFDTGSYYRFDSPVNEAASAGEDAHLMHVPDKNKVTWHHLPDLDEFFKSVYQYHQKHGFACIFLQQCFELVQFVFVVALFSFLFVCVDYDVLFANKLPPHFNSSILNKVTLHDAAYPTQMCLSSIANHRVLMFFIILAAVFWTFRAVKLCFSFSRLLNIRKFYKYALHIQQTELENVSWHEVQQRLMDVQEEQQLCIHKQRLSELDIYNRILRFKNYMVAMVNKGLLPPRLTIPFFGNVVFLTQSLMYNMELVFFWGPRAIFSSGYHMKPEYKQRQKREELTQKLSSDLLWLGVINLLLFPIIFLWQILYSFLSYAEVLKNEPGFFGARRWSLFAHLYFRHFNELPHEFHTRLKQGYKPASSYMDTSSSPILAVFARFVIFIAGAFLAVLVSLAFWDEDVFEVEHVITFIGVFSIVVRLCKSFIPDESAVAYPEKLMKKVIAHVHYMPDSWLGQAHMSHVRDEFSQLFQYKATFIIEELLSPIVTPFILIFWMRARSGDFIDFFRNFTVDIAGVGDVCSFAQMDIKRHGDPNWHETDDDTYSPSQQADDGKTELSLMHFTMTNPQWDVPNDGQNFLKTLHSKAQKNSETVQRLQLENIPHLSPVSLLGSLDVSSATDRLTSTIMVGGTGNHGMENNLKMREGSHAGTTSSRMDVTAKNLKQADDSPSRKRIMPSSAMRENAIDVMNVSALFIHELHHQRLTEEYTPTMWETIADDSADQMHSVAYFHKGYDATGATPLQAHPMNPDAMINMDAPNLIHRASLPKDTYTLPISENNEIDQHASSDSDAAPQEFHVVDNSEEVQLLPLNQVFGHGNNNAHSRRNTENF